MKAKFLKGKSDHRAVMWEVIHGASWWTVAFLTQEGSYHITGKTGRVVNPEGVMGRKIIAATTTATSISRCPSSRRNRKGPNMSAEPKTPDFTSMTAPQLLNACGDDALQWSIAFCQTAKKLGYELGDDPEGWMFGWFANAIEHSHDVRERRRKGP